VFPEPEQPSPEQIEIERLAATLGALNPERLAWRNDILVSAIVGVLSSRGALSVGMLTSALNADFRTDAITETIVVDALDAAFEAHLVSKERALDGTERWGTTDAAKAEATSDRQSAESVLEAFRTAVAALLDGMDDERLGADKADRVANHVYAAIGEAADGLYVLAPGADPTHIRPLRLDVGAIDRYTATIVPRSLRDAVVEITAAALDPDDSFGNDVVRLVTVGSLLHGLVTRRDLPAKPDLTCFRILLDTSVLIDLVVGTGAERQVMRDLVRCSQQLGVEVIVAEHTLEEWGRVWDAAETEATATLPEEISENTHRLASNPFAQAWA
jgi:hypothetical protein